jgi:hypothetical protein
MTIEQRVPNDLKVGTRAHGPRADARKVIRPLFDMA